jgi:hypothetical protein
MLWLTMLHLVWNFNQPRLISLSADGCGYAAAVVNERWGRNYLPSGIIIRDRSATHYSLSVLLQP